MNEVNSKLAEIAYFLDQLGFNSMSPSGLPGSTEKIAMELGDLNKTLERIAFAIESISELAQAVVEHKKE